MINSLERGGTERQFVTLAQGLSSGIFKVSTGCLARRGEFVSNLPKIAEFPPGNSLFKARSFFARVALARYLRRQQIVVAHAFDFYTNLMMIPAGWLAMLPVLIGSHRQLGDLLTTRQFQAQNAAFRLCDRVVCNSRAAADALKKAGISERKLVVIPNALPDEAFAETSPALPRQSGVLRVAMVARMNHEVKNHPLFLRMAARLSQRFPRAEFILIGDGPLRSGLEALARELGLSDRARFLGDRSDIPSLLASVDITVLPSRSESMSNAILESMAAGVPIVATDVGGNSEIIANGENGFLVAPDEQALAQAVGELLANDEFRRQCGERARLMAGQRYRLNVVQDRYEQLYLESLMAKTSRQELGKVRDLHDVR
jgi:glycosyltransferase involved in cell wall biosynthesis